LAWTIELDAAAEKQLGKLDCLVVKVGHRREIYER
jgi:hypothetical protein